MKTYELIHPFPSFPFETMGDFEAFLFENAIGITKDNWEEVVAYFANEYDSEFGINVYELD